MASTKNRPSIRFHVSVLSYSQSLFTSLTFIPASKLVSTITFSLKPTQDCLPLGNVNIPPLGSHGLLGASLLPLPSKFHCNHSSTHLFMLNCEQMEDGEYMFIFVSPSFKIGRRKWHPTPVLVPGKPHGWRSLAGCSPWGQEESNTTSLSLFTSLHWRRKWQPTPVFFPGESQGWGSLVGCHLWGRTESDTTEVT